MSRAAREQVDRQARDAAQRRLTQAEQFMRAHTRSPLFRKTIRLDGGRRAVVTLDRCGLLRVLDPATGELLAESVPGQPGRLRDDFLPGPDLRSVD